MVWCAWQAWQVNRDLDDAIDHANAFRAAVESGDDTAIDRELAALQVSSARATDRTSGVTWSVLTHLPAVGDDARGVRVVSSVVDDLAQDGVEPLITVRSQLDDLLPQEGVIPVDAVRSLNEPVARAEDALAAAEQALAGEDSSGYTGRLQEKYRDLQTEIADAHEVMESARIATEILPSMLGADEDRKYLLVFQNNAEIRATGGLAGAAALIEAHDGRLELTRQTPGDDFGRASPLPLPLTSAERRLYDDVIGAYFLSSNMTPDLPRAAELWAARWEQVYPDDNLDGVVTLDTVAVSYLLDAMGPITVDGLELTGDNLVDELLHNTYLRVDDAGERDAFFAQVIAAGFDEFGDGGGNPTRLLAALVRGTDEGRVAVHSFDDAEQQALAGTTVAAEFVTAAGDRSPQIGFTINDTTGGKMSYFLRYDVDISATYCSGGRQGFTAKARVWSEAPEDAADLPDAVTGGGAFETKPGNELITARVFGPVDGTVEDLTLNDEPLDPISVDQDGRPVRMFYIELTPGQIYDLAWTMESGAGQTAPPNVRVTPSIVEGAIETVAGAC